MKHSYLIECTCERCTKERVRRNAQAELNAGSRRFYQQPIKVRKMRTPRQRTPVSGSLEWAEQRGGLIGGYEKD